MKKTDLFDYYYDNIENDNIIKDIEKEAFYNKVTFNTFIALTENLLSDMPYDIELSKMIKKLRRADDKQSIYELIRKEYLYRYVKITVKSTDFPKNITRTMLIPLRTSIYEMMIGVLSTLNTLGYHLLSLYKGNVSFITPIDEIYEGLRTKYYSALDNYTVDILDLKNVKLWYDYGEDWIFNISFKGLCYLEHYLPFAILSFKGAGIIEDNKHLLYDYLDNTLDEEYSEWVEGFDDETLETLFERSLHEYPLLLKAYVGLNADEDDEENDEEDEE